MPEATAETTSVFRAELLNESDQQAAQSEPAVTGVEGLPEGQAL
ncbi:MAG: peptide-binding protein, partial [Dietzia cercidiphylli]